MTEDQLQAQVVEYLNRCWPSELPFFAVPNGGSRRLLEAVKLKRTGVLAGVPDLVLNLPGGRVGYIELKAEKGRLQPEQAAFRDAVVTAGARWSLCRSVREVQDAVTAWLEGSGVRMRGRVSA